MAVEGTKVSILKLIKERFRRSILVGRIQEHSHDHTSLFDIFPAVSKV